MYLTKEYRHCLQEVTTIAMGQSGERLARLLETFVVLSEPHIDLMAPADITMTLHAIDTNASVSAVCQGFIGGGIAGEAMLLFNDTSFANLAKLMRYDIRNDEQGERELLMDATNLLFGACLNGLSEQIDMQFSFGPPMVLGQHQEISELIKLEKLNWEQVLVIEVGYQVEGYDVNGDLLIIFTEDSMKPLFEKLSYLID